MELPGAQVELPGFTTASAPLWGTAPDFMATLDAGVGIERWKKCWKHLVPVNMMFFLLKDF